MGAGLTRPDNKDAQLLWKLLSKARTILSTVPDGFDMEWTRSDWFGRFKTLVSNFEIYHLYSDVVPLVRCEGGDIELYMVGGLLVLLNDIEPAVIRGNIPMPVLLSLIQDSCLQIPCRRVSSSRLHLDYYDGLECWWYERKHRGRNRAEELRQRGGIVDDGWFGPLGDKGDDNPDRAPKEIDFRLAGFSEFRSYDLEDNDSEDD